MVLKRKLAALAVGSVCLCAPFHSWSSEDHAAFVGLWQGVDNVDGSLRTISIADLDGDGEYEVLAHDTFWTLCDGNRGAENTTGTIQDDGTLRTIGTIECASGESVDVDTIYTPVGPIPGETLVADVVGQPFSVLLFRINRSAWRRHSQHR